MSKRIVCIGDIPGFTKDKSYYYEYVSIDDIGYTKIVYYLFDDYFNYKRCSEYDFILYKDWLFFKREEILNKILE